MSESFYIPTNSSKEEKYRLLFQQLQHLTEGEVDITANLANTAAALRSTFDFFWVGFYHVKNNQLVLGPFQGPVACTRIAFGKGVCGTAWETKKTVIVPDVDEFPGHIACSSLSKSEIVVPIIGLQDEVIAVLDVDSDTLNAFDTVDQQGLEQVARLIARIIE